MLRLTTLMLLSLSLVACQASVSEDFVEAIPSTTQKSSIEPIEVAATPTLIYTGTTDLSALTSTKWIVSEGSGNTSAPCHVKFSRIPKGGIEAAAPSITNSFPIGQAATSGCSNEELKTVTGWAVNGDTIELRNAEETTTAYLLMERPDLLLGYTAKGYDLVVSQ
ncbi:hypothetical protein [Pseudovibrio sp. Tun.PSC04-5.I4]|uniref:hypothetical protein n=1 Tax=Pseudovibrio sp. Tun.PSC04-5.I4 TaxID=1798213 RepID=UPI000888A525|nr:hypothetical protein [Pseudovibrio sp. Tun.PSC04-5.I4]SDQ80655.1 hypothetical protein SAMN04515695_1471 [Pseudovibrio sp. Tun.PSC04-5.I4]